MSQTEHLVKFDAIQAKDRNDNYGNIANKMLRTTRMRIASEMALAQKYGSLTELAKLYNQFIKALGSPNDTMDTNL